MYGEKQTITPNGSNQPNGALNTPSTPPPQSITPIEQKKNTIKTDILDLFAIFAGFFAVYFLISSLFSGYYFAVTGVYIAFLAFTVVYIVTKTKRFPLKTLFPIILSVLVAASFSVHTYEFYSPAVPFLFYLSGLCCMTLTQTKGYDAKGYISLYHQLKGILFIPVSKLFVPLISLWKNRKLLKSKKNLGVFVGILCGIPVFILVAKLLVEGDAAFSGVMEGFIEKIMKYLSEFSDSDSIVWVFPSLIFTPYIVSTIFAFRHGIVKEKLSDDKTEESIKALRFVSPSVLGGFYGAVAACYVIYLLSQVTYLFGAFSGEIPLGVSVSLSHYARRGFFEMSAVAFINLCLIGGGALLSKRQNGQLSKLFKGFSVFFCLFTMLLIVTAMSKMGLYITEMGLTHKRILVSLADIILFTAFLGILIKIFKGNFPYMKITMYTAISLMCLYFVVSPDYVIANFNTSAYLSGKHQSIDLYTIDDLDNRYYALVNLDRLTESDVPAIADDAKCMVYSIYQARKNDKEYNSAADLLIASYIQKNEDRIKTYADEYTSIYYDYEVSSEPVVDRTFESGSVNLVIRTSKDIESIVFSNECGSAAIYKPDTSSLFIYEGVSFDWVFPKDSDIFANVTVTTTDGVERTCTIMNLQEKDTDPDDHVTYIENSSYSELELRDNGNGGFKVVDIYA